MSEDSDNQRKAQADAPPSTLDEDTAGADRTVEISKAELAAIRQSASQPAISRELLSEMDHRRENRQARVRQETPRHRQETPRQSAAIHDDVGDEDSTRAFNRQSIDAMLRSGPEQSNETAHTNTAPALNDTADPDTVEVALDEASAPTQDEDLDVFSALSDDDIHDLIFNEDATLPSQNDASQEIDTGLGPVENSINHIEAQETFADSGTLHEGEDASGTDVPPAVAPPESYEEKDSSMPIDEVDDAPEDETPSTENEIPRAQPAPTRNETDEAVDFRDPRARWPAAGMGIAGVTVLVAGAARLTVPGDVLPPSFLGLVTEGMAAFMLVAGTALCAVAIWLSRQ